MQNTDSRHQPTGRQRRIGPIGTTARLVVGTLLLGSVVQGHIAGPFRPAPAGGPALGCRPATDRYARRPRAATS